MLYLGTILYVSLLLINAMAVLSEDRFLARSTSPGSAYCGAVRSWHPASSRLVFRAATTNQPRLWPAICSTIRPSCIPRSAGCRREGTANNLDQRCADTHAE